MKYKTMKYEIGKYEIIPNRIFNISPTKKDMTNSLISLSRLFLHLFFPCVFVAFTHQSKPKYVLGISSNLFQIFQRVFK